MSFSERLRLLLEENNMTQKQLAINLHIPVSTLGGYIQGTSEPDFQMLKSIAEYFNVTTDYLLNHSIDSNITDKEKDIIRIFRSLSNTQQKIYIEQGKAFLKVSAKE